MVASGYLWDKAPHPQAGTCLVSPVHMPKVGTPELSACSDVAQKRKRASGVESSNNQI